VTEAPRRPVLRWHGGKWRLAPWVISHFPSHRVYVEPFGGAASVLLRKPRSYAEVYNDLDRDVVGLFRVLQNPASAARLIELLRLTPFAREEFLLANQPVDGPIENSRRLIVRSFMGFGSNAHNERGMHFRGCVREGLAPTGFRNHSNRSGTTPAYEWSHYPEALAVIVERFQGVVVEHRDAGEVLGIFDSPDTLHYCDPPYMPETRSLTNKKRGRGYLIYKHELDEAGHAALLARLKELRGMVVLSGYASPLYDDALKGWLRRETDAYADGARPRKECLWLNPAAVEALGHGPLFAPAAS
jgi:DNA adenine methylase